MYKRQEHTLDAHHQRIVLSDWEAAATPPRLEALRLTLTDGAGVSWQRIPLSTYVA